MTDQVHLFWSIGMELLALAFVFYIGKDFADAVCRALRRVWRDRQPERERDVIRDLEGRR